MLSKRILKLQPSPTFALDAKVKQMQLAGIPVINLTLGEPDFLRQSTSRKLVFARFVKDLLITQLQPEY